MRHKRLRPVVGPWAAQDSFFDREEEVARLVRQIKSGASISLSAPRRVGKTSLMHAVKRALDASMTCVFVDLESSATAEDAIREIAEKSAQHQNLGERVRGWMSWIGGSVTAQASTPVGGASLDLRELLRVDWQARGSRLIADLTANGHDVVLFLDELPVLVASLLGESATAHGRNPADVFLSWLRRMTQEHRGRLRVVLTGSIGLGPMVARAGLSATLNSYEHERLEPWSPEIAVEALLALSAWTGTQLPEPVAGHMVELLGIGVPYHVQLFHEQVARDAERRPGEAVTAEDVDRVWRERLIRNPSADLPHWEQRLRKALSPTDYSLARRLLTEAALHEPLRAQRARGIVVGAEDAVELLRRLLDVLEHDGYLARTEGGWYFPNRLLRAWWAYSYGPLHDDEATP